MASLVHGFGHSLQNRQAPLVGAEIVGGAKAV